MTVRGLALGLGLLWLAAAPHAHAAGATKGEVLVILAKEETGAIDDKLKALRALQKPPLSAFKSMKVLSTTAVEISIEHPATVELPNGRTLQIKLLESMPDGRNKVQVSINRPGKQEYLQKATVNVSDEPFFVAGQRYEGGTLVIGVRLGGKG